MDEYTLPLRPPKPPCSPPPSPPSWLGGRGGGGAAWPSLVGFGLLFHLLGAIKGCRLTPRVVLRRFPHSRFQRMASPTNI